VISNLMGKANGTLGLNKQVITSGSTATAQSTSAQLAGAVDWLQTNNSSLAFIGDGATIDATGTSGSWNATGYALTGTAPSWSFGNTVAVQATGIAQSIDVGGNVGLTFFGTQGGSNALSRRCPFRVCGIKTAQSRSSVTRSSIRLMAVSRSTPAVKTRSSPFSPAPEAVPDLGFRGLVVSQSR